MSFGKASRSSRASTYSSNSGYRVDPDSIRENCQERATWNSAEISLLRSPSFLRRPCQGRCMVDSWVARWNFGGKPVYLERRCKDTSHFRVFPNFLAKKCKKLVFCNVEITNGVFRVVESCVCSPSCLKLWEDSKV